MTEHDEWPDEQEELLCQELEDQITSEANSRGACRNVTEDHEERLNYYLQAHRRSEILPHEVKETLREQGDIR